MKVRFMRPDDIPSLAPLIEREVTVMPPAFGATVEAGMQFGRQHLESGGFGLVVLGDDGAPVGCYIGRAVLMPAATNRIVADFFYSTSAPGAMGMIVEEIRHLASLWGCSGFTIGANGRRAEILERWGAKWGMSFLSTSLWGEVS